MAENTTSRRCPLWVKIVLAASLAINLGIAGLVAGFVLRGGLPPGGGPGALGYAMPYVVALPREVRRDVFGTVRRDRSLPDRRARRSAYDDIIAALRATPVDRDVVETVLRGQADGAARVQRVAQQAWLDAVMAMSDDERVAYAARIEEVLARGRKKDRSPRD